jgi:hypothetical protein
VKKVLLTLLLLSPLLSCTGDCFACHPQLLENIDANHEPMESCKNCHSDGGGTSACGADCFQCHLPESIPLQVEEHRVIDDCRNCHMNRIENPFENFSPKGNLRDILGL